MQTYTRFARYTGRRWHITHTGIVGPHAARAALRRECGEAEVAVLDDHEIDEIVEAARPRCRAFGDHA